MNSNRSSTLHFKVVIRYDNTLKMNIQVNCSVRVAGFTNPSDSNSSFPPFPSGFDINFPFYSLKSWLSLSFLLLFLWLSLLWGLLSLSTGFLLFLSLGLFSFSGFSSPTPSCICFFSWFWLILRKGGGEEWGKRQLGHKDCTYQGLGAHS